MTDTSEATAQAWPLAKHDTERHVAALAAADAPDAVAMAMEDRFRDLFLLTKAGDRRAAAGAALAVQDQALLLCVGVSASGEAATAKRRLLAVIVRWAWSRMPDFAAVLEAARAQERLRWGDDVEGSA